MVHRSRPHLLPRNDYESHAYVHHNEFHHTSFNVTCSVHVTIRQRGLKLTHLFHDQWKQQGILTLASMHTQLQHTKNNIHSKPWDTPDYDAVIFTTHNRCHPGGIAKLIFRLCLQTNATAYHTELIWQITYARILNTYSLQTDLSMSVM